MKPDTQINPFQYRIDGYDPLHSEIIFALDSVLEGEISYTKIRKGYDNSGTRYINVHFATEADRTAAQTKLRGFFWYEPEICLPRYGIGLMIWR